LNTLIDNDVSIELLACSDSNLSSNILRGGSKGIMLSATHNSNIVRNFLTNIRKFGIEVELSDFNFICNNSIVSDGDMEIGINVYGSLMSNVSHNELIGGSRGISLAWSDVSTIVNNHLTYFQTGIYMTQSHINYITDNCLSFNKIGILLDESSGNSIFHNNFIYNEEQAQMLLSPNTWDDGYPSGGNYWSDYNGTDYFSGPYQNLTGSDGIGDTPYIIDENNVDRYPLMTPYGTPLQTCNLTITATEGGTTAPVPGTYGYAANSTVEVTAIPDVGYSFDYWLLDGNNRTENPITVRMDADHVLEAYFAPSAEAGKPVAAFSWSPQYPMEGEPVVFDASASMPNGGEVVGYAWCFGDCQKGEGITVTHVYGEAGLFKATLTVVDSEGLTDSVSQYIFVRPKCFILTAVLGTQAQKDLNCLRAFRDKVLTSNPLGTAFVKFYYEASPTIADVLSNNELLKALTAIFFVQPILLATKMTISPYSPIIYTIFATLCLCVAKKGKLKTLLKIIGFFTLTAAALSITALTLGLAATIVPQASTIAASILPTIIPTAITISILKVIPKRKVSS
jgi:parallel beta-helix repeat protein